MSTYAMSHLDALIRDAAQQRTQAVRRPAITQPIIALPSRVSTPGRKAPPAPAPKPTPKPTPKAPARQSQAKPLLNVVVTREPLPMTVQIQRLRNLVYRTSQRAG